MQWSDDGIVASYKFLQKLWTLNQKILEELNKNHKLTTEDNITKFTNKMIKKFTENLNNFNYNILIANLHETYSFL